jgi:cytochrome c-type biogenesis protein CcmH
VRRAADLILALAAAWIVCLPAWAGAASLDDQVYGVAQQLMCPVCAGQTVAESDSALAQQMKAIIRQKLQAGESPQQILRYFVGQFGDGVLAEPRPAGVSLLLYAAPPLALAAGVGIAVLFIRRSRHARVEAAVPPAGHPEEAP